MAKENNKIAASITRHLFQTACDQVDRALACKDTNEIDDETRFGLSAILLTAVALEGAINDVGEAHLGTWAWERLEKADTALKWFVLSKFISGEAFRHESEPLNTVSDLMKLRNKLAHPKMFPVTNDVIIRFADGTLLNSNSQTFEQELNRPIQDADAIFIGCGQLRETFGAEPARRFAQRAFAALVTLNTQATLIKFQWLNSLKSKYAWLQ